MQKMIDAFMRLQGRVHVFLSRIPGIGEPLARALSWYMAIFPTAIGYTLFYIGVQRRGPAWASAFGYLVPSITAGLDCFFFGAAFSVPMIGGTTLVVLGLATSSLHSKRGSSGQE